ncbi:hypothetical protein F5X68DRAFT_235827 [Plectosphaerella plurivora]|uniref:Gamma interferon inducible lysosomal thiol reductase n=1 Tax=Plectosphaerella plurivora TaxID=936078 RepID=A0A9P8V465_9PEZI|nr:hypothetical protein F5X68DRAFT_235827 [Plectosphaerella plurivora]
MDEKLPAFMSSPRQSRRSRSILLLMVVGFLGFTMWQTAGTPRIILKHDHDLVQPEPAQVTRLVPLEAHIMSKCPDARDCLRDMILPVMMRVQDKVNWTLSFVGTPTANDGVDCRHGPSECMGNIIELCAAKLYPDPKISLGFTMCITRNYRQIPEQTLIEDCALEHAIDIKALNECAAKEDGAYGVSLLRDSVQRTADSR